VTPDDWETLRDVRLTALQESPYAFGSNYAREAAFTEEQWLGRINDRSDHAALLLWVTESNTAARKLYERCGFTLTGERQPLPSDPALPEIRMRRLL
jgi:ribosomal protein S18 acetylase RimI-like enzyme